MLFRKKKIEDPKESGFSQLRQTILERYDNGKHFRILLIEDNPIDVKVFRRKVRSKNVHVEYSLDVDQALNMLEKRRYELVVIDFQMPKMDGIELLRQIVENKSIKVLFTGVDLNSGQLQEISELGAFYINKKELGLLARRISEMTKKFIEKISEPGYEVTTIEYNQLRSV